MNLFILGLGYLYLGVKIRLAISLLIIDILLEVLLPLIGTFITLAAGIYFAYDAYKIVTKTR